MANIIFFPNWSGKYVNIPLVQGFYPPKLSQVIKLRTVLAAILLVQVVVTLLVWFEVQDWPTVLVAEQFAYCVGYSHKRGLLPVP